MSGGNVVGSGVNASKVTEQTVDKGWLLSCITDCSSQHSLSSLPSLFEQLSFFTTP
jgi:hypothetical protein